MRTSTAKTETRRRPVACASVYSAPLGNPRSRTSSSLKSFCRAELHDATRIGRCASRVGGSTSARQANTMRRGLVVFGVGAGGVLVGGGSEVDVDGGKDVDADVDARDRGGDF